MRLDITYLTRFDYPAPVRESQNELRACPTTDDRQQLVHYDVTSTPSSRVVSYVDFWGTRVDTFGIRPRHEALEVVAAATVDTGPAAVAPASMPWARVEEQRFLDAHFSFLQRSPHVDWGHDVAEAARRAITTARGASGDDLIAAIRAVHNEAATLDFRPGATYVGVGVDDVYGAGAGVCQDFAHLAVAMYRSALIPARYVSGYLFATSDETGEDVAGDEVEVQTHAWVEVAVPGFGWWALDPTNDQEVGERHVTIGRGRDYDDVAPFRGIYNGAAAHKLTVSVHMRRLAPEPYAGAPGSGHRPSTVAAGQQQQQQ
ncbi:MAG: transglutaminase family protein [Nitriliruptoraceae bacterium]